MSLTLALNNALTGLNVNQQALAVLSQNIANANTKGYSRQILNQSSVYLDGRGAGVNVDSVTRRIDEYLQGAMRLQDSNVGQTSVLNDYYGRIQLLLGQPGNNNSIDAFTNTFFNSLHSLAQTPQDTTLQRQAVNSGVSLADQVAQLAQGLQELQVTADGDISAAVQTINTDLKNIADLNSSIANNVALGKGVADLEDKRDALLTDISQYLDIQTFKRQTGAINISTRGGVALLDDNLYELQFTPATTTTVFANNGTLSPLSVQRLDASGNPVGRAVQIISGGTTSTVVSAITSGKIDGLIDLRDRILPDINEQLDTLAGTLRDQMNAVHNLGTGFPGAASYTGTRLVGARDSSQWAGSVRVAVLDNNGQPIASPYPNQLGGLPPLTLDLSTLDTGGGAGNPSVQGIIDEINRYYGVPQNKVQVGNLSNIRLAADSNTIPGVSSQFNFDFDLENTSATPAKFFVTGVQVLDSTNADITSVSSTIPSVALDPANTYITTAGSQTVTITSAAPHNFINGQRVFLSTPGAAVDGIPAAQLGGFFTISNVTSTTFQINVSTPAVAGLTTAVAAQTAEPPYATVDPGDTMRTSADGLFTANLLANNSSPFYTIKATVAVDDGTGNLTQSVISYHVTNFQTNLLNTRYVAQAATGGANIVLPTSNQVMARALLVDANGNELPITNGQYTTLEQGYLKIEAANSSNIIAIDSLDSAEQGKPNDSPPQPGTNRGFSHYFDLNDFFVSNLTTATGDTIAGSALKLAVTQALVDNPRLLSTGTLTAQPAPIGSDVPPYTYERNSGDNSLAQRLAQLGNDTFIFAAAGGLGTTQQNFAGYAGQMIGGTSTDAATAKNNEDNAQTLLDGYNQRSSSISGVKLDEELANTVIYQNAYAASARIITVTSDLFNALLQAF